MALARYVHGIFNTRCDSFVDLVLDSFVDFVFSTLSLIDISSFWSRSGTSTLASRRYRFS